MARTWSPLNPPKDFDRRAVEIFKQIDLQIRDLSASMGQIGRGQTPDGSGRPIIDVTDTGRFFVLKGRPFGQKAHGAIEAGGSLWLSSTYNTTKGNIYFGVAEESVYDEVNNRFGIGINPPAAALHVYGEVDIITYATVNADRTIPINWLNSDGTSANMYTYIDENATNYSDANSLICNSSTPAIFDWEDFTDPGDNDAWTLVVRCKMSSASTMTAQLCDNAGVAFGSGPGAQSVGTSTSNIEIPLSNAHVTAAIAAGISNMSLTIRRNAGVTLTIYAVWLQFGAASGYGLPNVIIEADPDQFANLFEIKDYLGLTRTVVNSTGNWAFNAPDNTEQAGGKVQFGMDGSSTYATVGAAPIYFDPIQGTSFGTLTFANWFDSGVNKNIYGFRGTGSLAIACSGNVAAANATALHMYAGNSRAYLEAGLYDAGVVNKNLVIAGYQASVATDIGIISAGTTIANSASAIGVAPAGILHLQNYSGVGTKVLVVKALAGQTGNLFDVQSSAGTSLIDITGAGRLTIESGGTMRIVPNAGANRLWTADANGDMTLVAVGGDLTLATGTWTIANDAVTYAKMQNVSAADRLLGRGNGGGAGDVQEIILGTNLSMTGTTLNAAGGGGGGAATTEPFVTIGNTAGLSAERALAVGAALSLVDGGANASVTLDRAALTGDVTAPAGSNATTIAANAVTTAKILDGNVTAAKIADRTREDFLNLGQFVQSNGTGAALTLAGVFPDRYRYIPFVTAPATTPQAWHTTWQVPQDYVSGGTITIYWYAITLNDNAAVMRAHYLARAKVPENDTTTAELITAAHTTITKVMTGMGLATLPTPRAARDINYVNRTDIGSMAGALAAGDVVSLQIDRNTAHASDTYTGDLRLLGVSISYTADS